LVLDFYAILLGNLVCIAFIILERNLFNITFLGITAVKKQLEAYNDPMTFNIVLEINCTGKTKSLVNAFVTNDL
jgi:hypothetical protein